MTALLEVARFERDRRERLGPDRASEINRTSGSPAEAAQRLDAMCVDYQCWVAIAEWLETDRFLSFTGGADPDKPDAPLIRWPELELAASSALNGISERIARLEGDAAALPETLGTLRARRSCLFAIHEKVRSMRAGIDELNAKLRVSTSERKAA